MGKLIGLLAVILLFVLLFFPRRIPRWFRTLGRAFGDVGRAGKEIASGEEVPGSPLARYEAQAGGLIARKMMATHRVVSSGVAADSVHELGEKLAAVARRHEIDYRFRVLDLEEVNAFAVAGGHIFVSASIVDLCGDDPHCLAGVLGHEIAHVDCRHALKNLAAKAAARTGTRLLLAGKGAVLRHLTGGMEDLLFQGYHQDVEFEADRVGAELARAAGFDPLGQARLLERLEALYPDGDEPFWEIAQYFRSHPPLGERVERLRRLFTA